MADITFAYSYQVNLVGGIYSIDTGVGDVTGSATITITDTADYADDNLSILGDILNDIVDWKFSNGIFGTSSYVGLANAAAQSSGILILNPSNGNYYYLTNTESSGDLTVTLAPDAICFMPGTMIRTPEGELPVEALKRGDLVTTTDGRAVPVTWLGRQTISRLFADPARVLPIRIMAGALAENTPSRDLLISPEHAVLVDGVLIQAGALVNGASIVRETEVPPVFTYYHVELDDHSLILAENTPAETFVDNVDRLNFDNWAEHHALYPEGRSINELPYPRAKAHRQVPVATRVKLGERAREIGAAADVAAA